MMEKTEDNIIFRIKTKTKTSMRFYITRKKLESLYINQFAEMLDRDIHSFVTIRKNVENIYFEFCFLDSAGTQVKGYLESFYLDANDFINWFCSKETHYTKLDKIIEIPAKLDFKACVLTDILNSALHKRAFIKAVRNLLYRTDSEYKFCNDSYSSYSFDFVCYNGNQRSYNGGLICHLNETFIPSQKTRVKRFEYSMHT